MQTRRAFLTFAFAFWCAVRVSADPVNFIVGPFTMTRPVDWVWKDLPDKSHSSALLSINDNDPAQQAQVLVSFTRSSRENVAKGWENYFVEPLFSRTNVLSKIKEFPVTYVMAEGTFRAARELKPKYALLGVIVETSKGNVCGRVIGPKAVVDKSAAQFKKMIEDALKEE